MSTPTYQYFYTIEAWMNWSYIDITTSIPDQQNTTEAGVYSSILDNLTDLATQPPSVYCLYRESSTKNTSKTAPAATTFTLPIGYQVQYRIRFYQLFSGTYYWLTNSYVTVHNATSVSGFTLGKVNTDHNTFAAAPTISHQGVGDTFWFTVTPNAYVASSTTPFTLSGTITAGGLNGDSGTYSISSSMLLNVNPTVLGTPVPKGQKVPVTPHVPQSFLDVINSTPSGYPPTPGDYVWDWCNQKWHGVYKAPNSSLAGVKTVVYQEWECTVSGKPTKVGGLITDKDGSKYKALVSGFLNYTKGNCADPANAAGPKGPGGGGGGPGGNTPPPTTNTDVAVTYNPPSGDVRWNPPPHKFARDTQYAQRVANNNGWTIYGPSNISRSPDASWTVNSPATLAGWFDPGTTFERGRLFQDSNGAQILNKVSPGKGKTLGTVNQWGFRFMYNPTSFMYQTSTLNNIDWTLGPKNSAALLAGNSQVSFDIYINRIPDMRYLTNYNPTNDLSESAVYGRTLLPEERSGMVYRGTEYDIEFLYRVLNGDPDSSPLLLNPNYGGESSDFGYTTAVPCWLWLNDNMRYYGSMASFSVNHVIFDARMVPILSVVSMTFSRIPALGFDAAGVRTQGTTAANVIAAQNAANGVATGGLAN